MRSDRFRQELTKTHLPTEVPADVRLLSGKDGAAVFDVRAGADKLARQIQQTVGLPRRQGFPLNPTKRAHPFNTLDKMIHFVQCGKSPCSNHAGSHRKGPIAAVGGLDRKTP